MKKKCIKYGWRSESIETKIKEVLALSLEQRFTQGLVTGKLAEILERNQKRLYGRGLFRTIQVLKRESC